MSENILALSTAAVSIGFIHTLFGPDHYLPFIMLSRSEGWSLSRTSLVTLLCGIGHVLSSVVLGMVGIFAGLLLSNLESIESVRGEVAAVLLTAFGVIYMLWGLKKARGALPHEHVHLHGDGVVHLHLHDHNQVHPLSEAEKNHEHPHQNGKNNSRLSPWVLFIIFVLGPCEPLIPLMMYPAAQNDLSSALVVVVVFSLTTLATMLAIVVAIYKGLKRLNLGALERYSHFIAGFTIALCGAAILFLGL